MYIQIRLFVFLIILVKWLCLNFNKVPIFESRVAAGVPP